MQQQNPYSTPGANVSAGISIDTFDESSPFSPSGRFGRMSYLAWGWGVMTLVYIAGIGVGMLLGLALGIEWAAGLVIGLMAIVMLVVAWIFMIRRLHDIDMAGWWSLLILLPLVNIIFGLYLMFKSGTPGANNFGPPRETKGWETALAWIGIILMGLGVVGGIIAAIAIPQYQQFLQQGG